MKFRHIGIVPLNIESSIKFYEEFLGFKIEVDTLETGKFVNKICGLQENSVRTVKMSSCGQIVLELLEFKNDSKVTKSKKVTDSGYTHMAITVVDVDKMYNLWKDKIEFTTYPLNSPDKKAKVTFCEDPDGNLIELVQEI